MRLRKRSRRASRLDADFLEGRQSLGQVSLISTLTDEALAAAHGHGWRKVDERLRLRPMSGQGKSVSHRFRRTPMSPSRCMSVICAFGLSSATSQRLFRANGWRCDSSDVHPGDWGLQMGQLISETRAIAASRPDRTSTPSFTGSSYPDTIAGQRWTILRRFTPVRIRRACVLDPARLDEARKLRRPTCRDGRPRLSCAVANNSSQCRVFGLRTRIRQPRAYPFRSAWKGEASAEPLIAADDRGLEIASHHGSQTKARWLSPVVRAERQEADAAADPAELDGEVLYGTTDLATIRGSRARN